MLNASALRYGHPWQSGKNTSQAHMPRWPASTRS